MSARATDSGKRAAPTPRWEWSGVQAIDFRGRSKIDLRRIAKLLPQRQSSIDKIVARLREMRGRYHRYLWQDEFGPTRADRAQALKVLVEKMEALRAEIDCLSPQLRGLLAEELLAIWSPTPSFDSDPVDSHAADRGAIEAFAAATATMRQDLLRAGAVDQADALDKLCSAAETAAMFLTNLDSTTDSDVVIHARSTDLAPVSDDADAVSFLIERIGGCGLGLNVNSSA